MKGKLAFVVGAGVGYLLGTRAGRQQFEKIKTWASDTWNDPRVQGYVHDAEQAATDFARTQGGALKDKAVSTAKSAFSGDSSDPDASDASTTPSTTYPSTTTTPPSTPTSDAPHPSDGTRP